jgi:KaiC/GvpD/RAD55 family RecA-like ATPase
MSDDGGHGASGGGPELGGAADGDDEHPRQPTCDFCRYDVELEPVTLEREGQTYEFCSVACRDRLLDNEYVFTEFHGGRRVPTGVSGLDPKLPQGVPRNSFVLVSGMAGTRKEAVLVELAWRTLQRGERVVAVTLTEPPESFVQQFLSLDWNVIPYLERGQLRIVDAFTFRMDDRDRMFDRMNRWNRHLHGVTEDATETVRDAGDMSELANTIDNCLEAHDGTDQGLVLIDSLTELGSLVQPVQAYDFVKNLRADVCKGRYVPVFAGATFDGNAEAFPHDLGYVVDGVVELELAGDIVEDTLFKRIRIRKMAGVLAIAEWTAFEYTGELGMVTFDPREELDADAPPDGAGGSRPDPSGVSDGP